ncbi:MAG: tRNA pseudouridine synthase A, partial [Naasia sp.]
GFSGWAKQPGKRTVQGVLEDALAILFSRSNRRPQLTVAGRTDAGGHARGQVAHVDLTDVEVAALRRRGRGDPANSLAWRLNGVLGSRSDVVVSSAAIAAPGFDARFSAEWRRYEYRIADSSSERDPLQRYRTHWLRADLDLDLMREGAASLLGLGDFAAFCRPREGASTIRTLQEFSWTRDADGVLVATLQADAFCHSMVRSLVGGCVAVGEGRLQARGLTSLLGADGRSGEFVVQPAVGLTLLAVGYPDDSLLALRAQQTRALRSPEQVTRDRRVAADEIAR